MKLRIGIYRVSTMLEPKERRGSERATRAAIVVLATQLIYFLSLGPLVWLTIGGWIPWPIAQVYFAPVDWVFSHFPQTHEFLMWYRDQFWSV